MNLSRLLLLGALDRHGPRHGHRIRRAAEQANVAAWGGVTVGALYREMRALDEEGLIAAVRTETEGRRPARTIYEITPEGRRELAILREQAIAEPRQAPDAVAVALAFGGVGERGVVLPLLARATRRAAARGGRDRRRACASRRRRAPRRGGRGGVPARRAAARRGGRVDRRDHPALEADAKRRGGPTSKRADRERGTDARE